MGTSNSNSSLDGIAIIGMAGRFPGAKTVEEFWQNLCAGKESIHSLSDEELSANGVGQEFLSNPRYVKAAGLLEDIEWFDADFFHYSPREAEVTDPQHRLFLESAWHAVEDAGWDLRRHAGPVGVFAGAGTNTYLFNLYADPAVRGRLDSNQISIGNEREYLTSRVAYKLNLRGPAITVQTACSTSLVAVHMACQSLLTYECDMALAGGVLVCAQRSGYLYIEGGFLSPDGHNRSFDAAANGSVGGNGVCVVALRRLEDALNDRDHIYAVIRASAVNNDGSWKAGFTAPGVQGQAEVIARAQALAGFSPHTISYMEAHGTATALGDPAEIAAYKRAFHQVADRKQFCAIGSVKSNIGHLGEAAGIAALAKTALCLFHKKMVPSLHFRNPNPALDLEASPFYVNTKFADWHSTLAPRRAGVSSFGIGGTNAHVVLEEPPAAVTPTQCTDPQLILLSARTRTALEMATQNLTAALSLKPEMNLADAAYTLQTGRQAFRHRRAAVCFGADDAITVLRGGAGGRLLTTECLSEEAHPVFLFPGVGDQYLGMARDLYENIAVFRSVLDECFEILRPLMDHHPASILYPRRAEATTQTNTAGTTSGVIDFRRMVSQRGAIEQEGLNLVSHVHPILFALEYALARLWMHWGVKPSFMIGYSLGEYVAACIAGVFSLSDALTLVTRRAHMIERLPRGTMLAVPCSATAAESLVDDEIFIAAVNSPALCVLSGSEPAIADLRDRLTREGQVSRRISSSHAIHSGLMDPLYAEVRELLQGIPLNHPSVPYISSITGDWITPTQATDPEYWARHLSQRVQFSKCVSTASQHRNSVFLELGAGKTLGTLVLQNHASDDAPLVVSSLRHAYETGLDTPILMESAGKLWLAGVQVDWTAVHRGKDRCRVSLPGYPFERQRYWIEPNDTASAFPSRQESTADVGNWFYLPEWQRSLPASPSRTSDNSENQCWLIFSDENDVREQLSSRLNSKETVWVRIGSTYAKNSDHSYTIDPMQREHCESLFNEVLKRCPNLYGIVHFWTIAESSHFADRGQPDFERTQERGFYSLLNIASALRTARVHHRLTVFVVSNHLFGVTAEEPLCPAKSTMVGLAMVAQQENPQLTFRCVDVEFNASGKLEERTVDPVVRELKSDSDEFAVAVRGTQRWVRRYRPLPLVGENASEPKLRVGGTYLLTGGLGSIGLLLADHLARKWQANLVLTGRSKLPHPDSWSSLPKTSLPEVSDGDELSKITKLQDIKKNAGDIMLAQADAAEYEEMEKIFRAASDRFGDIDGVFHLAGTTIVKTVEEITKEDCVAQFRAKIHGTYVLEKLAGLFRPDFCVLFSSNAAILGGLGFAAYSAANCFLDTFAAQANKSTSTRWISVNWDGWLLPGQKTPPRAQNSSMFRYVMKPEESLDALQRALGTDEPQLVVSRLSLADRVKLWIKRERLFQTSTGKQQTSIGQHRRPRLANEYVPPRDHIEKQLTGIFGELLGVQDVGVHDNFFELGGNSLVALQLFARVRTVFEVDLPLRIIFEAPSVFQLKEKIEVLREEMIRILEQLENEQSAAGRSDG